MIKPAKLNKGDTIGIVSLASPAFRPSALAEAKKNLESKGFKIKISESISAVERYLAGDDKTRLDEFHKMIEDPGVKAVMSTRGGYGSSRLLPELDFDLIAKNPKIIIGYSDITSILTAVTRKLDLVTFYGPMFASEFKDPLSGYTYEKFSELLVEKVNPIEIKADGDEDKALVFCEGDEEGELTGGCLTLLTYTLGTPYEIDTKGKILFIEDIGEAPYRIDGMLTHLLNAGKLQECAGIVFGEMIDCDPPDYKPGYPTGSYHWEEVLADRLGNLGIPVLANVCFGHGTHKATVPLGTKARLDTAGRRFVLTETAVE